MEADPIGIKRGENHLYGYVANNPVDSTDPYGLRIVCGCKGTKGSRECWKTFDCREVKPPPLTPETEKAFCIVVTYVVCPIVGAETFGALGTACGLVASYIYCPDPLDVLPDDDNGMCMKGQ